MASDYFSPILKDLLDKVKTRVMKKDMDWVCVIDGRERSGKSTLAQQIAKELDPNFNIDCICFNAEDFSKKILTAPKFSAIILDEAFMDVNAKDSMSKVTRELAGLATEMGQLNLFVIICIPSYFDLLKYFAIFRTFSLFHVYFDENYNRGQVIVFPWEEKKNLFVLGKKFYDYRTVKSPYPPIAFVERYEVDEAEYRKRKMDALHMRAESDDKTSMWSDSLKQRNILINHIIDIIKPKRDPTISYTKYINDIFVVGNVKLMADETIHNIREKYKKQNKESK